MLLGQLDWEVDASTVTDALWYLVLMVSTSRQFLSKYLSARVMRTVTVSTGVHAHGHHECLIVEDGLRVDEGHQFVGLDVAGTCERESCV